ncbi:hypothetical protein A3Q56_05185 [Intoshia linei]|uniref:Uncharacterized protein n=1 Tax=Intoshia linei TaxID=1819745 RepID=A0A177AYD6_9BILA|nr:hypothetical protein A3Q56_05185 [Intoshia linei]
MFKIFRKNNLRKDTRTEKRNDMFKLKWSNPLGFPHKPSAICYDSKCHLLAIGTSFGLIRVYGKPGVCYYGQFSYDIEIVKLEFILGKGILICLTNDNMLTLWKLTSNRSIKMIIFSKINKEEFIITCFSVMNASFVICGTDLGNVCFLGLPQLNRIVKKDIFFSKIHSIVNIKSQMNYRRIQKITVCPCDSEKWIIAFSRSLIVIYNIENDILLYSFTHEEELQDICWNPSGKSFIMSTVHGSYIQWNLHESSAGIPKTPYGPDPCKPMNNIFVSSLETYGYLIIIRAVL